MSLAMQNPKLWICRGYGGLESHSQRDQLRPKLVNLCSELNHDSMHELTTISQALQVEKYGEFVYALLDQNLMFKLS